MLYTSPRDYHHRSDHGYNRKDEACEEEIEGSNSGLHEDIDGGFP